MGFIAEGACARSSGVSLTMAQTEVDAVSDSDKNEVNLLDRDVDTTMKPVYQRLNLSVLVFLIPLHSLLTFLQIYCWPGCLHLYARGTARGTVPHHTQVDW